MSDSEKQTFSAKLLAFKFVHLQNIRRRMQNDDVPSSSVFNRIISQGEVDTEFGIKAASKLRDQEREASDTMNPEVVDEYAAADEY